MSVQLEPTGRQWGIGNDVTSGTVDANGLSDLDDLEQVRADCDADLGLRWRLWGEGLGLSLIDKRGTIRSRVTQGNHMN